MASRVLVKMTKAGAIYLGSHTKCIMYVLPGISQPPTIIIWYANAEKFRYDDYLAISVFKLLSYVVGAAAQFGEHYCDFFRLKWMSATLCPYVHTTQLRGFTRG